MTELLWILTWLPLVLTAVSELPAPYDVKVTLDESGYILRWEPGAGTAAGTWFSVAVTVEDTSRNVWCQASGCQHVQSPLICNLTGAFKDLTEPYDIQVKAHLGNRTSQTAWLNDSVPLKHLPLPELKVAPCGPNICVDLLPPQLLQHIREQYDMIKYQLRIKSSDHDEAKVRMFRPLRSHNESNLVPGRDYCFSIRFSHDLVGLNSNFSKPYCVSTPGKTVLDAVVSVVLGLLVLGVIIVFFLLFWTGFICLKPTLMPSVLTSIHHLEVRLSTWSASLSSLQSVWLMAPPVGKSSSSVSEEDDEESCRETSDRNSLGANYALRPGASLLSSSSSSSTSLSSSSKPEPPPSPCCIQTVDGSPLQPEARVALETQPGAEQNPQRPDSVTEVRTGEKKEVKVGEEVNLSTLTFGLPEKEEEEEEEDCPDVPEEFSALVPPLVQPPHPAAAAEDEEEDAAYGDCDYMCRLPAAVS